MIVLLEVLEKTMSDLLYRTTAHCFNFFVVLIIIEAPALHYTIL